MERPGTALIEGFITHDAELTKSKTGKSVLMFSLAINHFRKPGEPGRVSFIEVEAWEDVADKAVKQAVKGKRVKVEGRLRQDMWKEGKETHSRIKIFADKITFNN